MAKKRMSASSILRKIGSSKAIRKGARAVTRSKKFKRVGRRLTDKLVDSALERIGSGKGGLGKLARAVTRSKKFKRVGRRLTDKAMNRALRAIG